MKKCSRCQETKPLIDFYKAKNKQGVQSHCKKCDNWRKTQYIRKKHKEEGCKPRYYTLDAKKDFENGTKYCPKCETKKPLSEFLTNKASSTGIDFHCKECKRKLVKQYGPSKEKLHHKYINNKMEVRDSRLKTKFGITLEEYNNMLKSQDGVCAICGITPEQNGKALSVDHCHTTGKIRGILCNNCNVALGFIKENIERAKGLIGYINKYIIGEQS